MGVELRGGEVAPAKLGHIFFRRVGQRWLRGGCGFDGVCDATRRDLAETQVRRQARGGARRKNVALIRIKPERPGGESLKRGERARFARRFTEAELAGPVGLRGSKLERLDRDALRRFVRPRRRGQAFGRWRRSGQGPERAMAAPEGGKDADRLAAGLAELPRLAHQPAVEARGFDAALLERRLDPGVERNRLAFVAAAPEDAACIRRGSQREDRLLGVAFDNVEPRAASGKRRLHRGQQLGEPPFRRPAQRTRPGARLVVDIDEKRGTIGGGMDRRLVIEAEIVAQPDDIDACTHEPSSRRGRSTLKPRAAARRRPSIRG